MGVSWWKNEKQGDGGCATQVLKRRNGGIPQDFVEQKIESPQNLRDGVRFSFPIANLFKRDKLYRHAMLLQIYTWSLLITGTNTCTLFLELCN